MWSVEPWRCSRGFALVTEARADKIAAIVVTFNRKVLLGQCLDSLLAQSYPLDAIYVIDNCSSDGTGTYLCEKEWVDPSTVTTDGPAESLKVAVSISVPDAQVEIRYIRLGENTGGAGGFHEGIQRGCTDGFDWLWLMDDDLLTDPDAVAALVQKRDALRAAGDAPFLLNSLVFSKEHRDGDTLAFPLQELSRRRQPKIGVYYYRLSEVRDMIEDGLYRWACPFNGTLIPTAAIAQIGLPDKDLFIWGDERDFLWRAAKVLEMYTVIESRVYHPPFPGFTFDWKTYYQFRNSFVVNEHLTFSFLRNLKVMVIALLMGLRYRKLGLALRAIRDGLTRNLGRKDDLVG